MANNRCASSFLSQNPSITLGTKRGFVVSNKTITTNNDEILSQNLSEGLTKRSRGRPKGSKNRPKLPIIIKENDNSLMESILIEIPPGRDIVESLINLAWSRQARIIVLNGSGPISEVNFLHPITRVACFPVKGMFHMTSFFGTFANANNNHVPPKFPSTNSPNSYFSIFLSGNQGQVFGGIVGGKVIAAGVVLITATLVKNPTFSRLGRIDVDRVENESNNSISTNG